MTSEVNILPCIQQTLIATILGAETLDDADGKDLLLCVYTHI